MYIYLLTLTDSYFVCECWSSEKNSSVQVLLGHCDAPVDDEQSGHFTMGNHLL